MGKQSSQLEAWHHCGDSHRVVYGIRCVALVRASSVSSGEARTHAGWNATKQISQREGVPSNAARRRTNKRRIAAAHSFSFATHDMAGSLSKGRDGIGVPKARSVEFVGWDPIVIPLSSTRRSEGGDIAVDRPGVSDGLNDDVGIAACLVGQRRPRQTRIRSRDRYALSRSSPNC